MESSRGATRAKVRLAIVALLACSLGGSIAAADAAPSDPPPDVGDPLRILVTNDDGVGAAGIAKLVDALQNIPNSEVTVIAPATNQSGTGASFSTTPITVAPATTASGDAATAVQGTPADSVLYGVLAGMPEPPDVVVSGINFGQNLGNVTELSGTVGAARTANRLGIPAIALSQGAAVSVSYGRAALSARLWVELFRTAYEDGTARAQTLNINMPTCASGGSVRGLMAVPLGRTSDIGGYTVQSGTVGNGTFQPTEVSKLGISASNCNATETDFDNDIDAFNNGFSTLTTLNPDFGAR